MKTKGRSRTIPKEQTRKEQTRKAPELISGVFCSMIATVLISSVSCNVLFPFDNSVLSDYSGISNNHFSVKFSIFKDVFNMLADIGYAFWYISTNCFG